MQISEIFKSCQGEGVCAGLPTVFIRLQGCNLYPNGCSFCDTGYAQDGSGRRMDSSEVVVEVDRFSNGCRRVCISGGEPLYQAVELRDLVDSLRFRDYFIEVFTNSTLRPPTWFSFVHSWVVDIKCPSSGVAERCLVSQWLGVAREEDAVKFVVSDQRDLDYAMSTLRVFGTKAQVLLSPMIPNCPDSQFGEVLMSQRKWLQTVWEFCVEHGYRYSFQLHKLVYGSKRGV